MEEKEKAVREVGVQVNLCSADVKVAREEDDGVTLLGRQGLTLRIGGEEGLYQEVGEGLKEVGEVERAKQGEGSSQLGPPLPPRAEHKRKDLCAYLGFHPRGRLQGRKDIMRFLGMAQNVKQGKSKEISSIWGLAQNMVWPSKDSERKNMGRGFGMWQCFLTAAGRGNQNRRREEDRKSFLRNSAAFDEVRVVQVLSTFRDGWEEEEYPGESCPIHNLNRNSLTSSLSQSSLSSNLSSPSSSTASSTSSLSSACARPGTSSCEEPIYMDMVGVQLSSSSSFLSKISPPRALISEERQGAALSSNDYMDMTKMKKVLDLIH